MSINAADALMGIFGFKRVEEKAMDKVNETRRALFEAIFFPCRRGTPKPTVSGRYVETVDEARWQGFNAALDAVEIELPNPISEHNTDVRGFVNPVAEEYDECLADCRAAIESTNLGLRIK